VAWQYVLHRLQIVMAKLMDPGPVLVLSFQAQQLTLKRREGQVEQVRRTPFA